MSKKSLVFVLTAVIVFSGCISSQVKQGDHYTMTTYVPDPTFNEVEMQTYNPESEFFSFLYDTHVWTIEEWEDAPGHVALLNKKYVDKTCYLLPGSIGHNVSPGQELVPGVLLTSNGKAETLDIYNAAGTRLRHIVAYKHNDIPYLFELKLPASEWEECYQDGQLVNASFLIEEDEVEEDEEAPQEEEGSESSEE
jgi:hypothetical protein